MNKKFLCIVTVALVVIRMAETSETEYVYTDNTKNNKLRKNKLKNIKKKRTPKNDKKRLSYMTVEQGQKLEAELEQLKCHFLLDKKEKDAAKEKEIAKENDNSTLKYSLSGNVNFYTLMNTKNRPNYGGGGLYTRPAKLVFDQQTINGSPYVTSPSNGHFELSADFAGLSAKAKAKDYLLQLDVEFYCMTDPNGGMTPSLNIGDLHAEWKDLILGYTYSNFCDNKALGAWLIEDGLQGSQFTPFTLKVQYNLKIIEPLIIKFSIEAADTDCLSQTQPNQLGSQNNSNSYEPDLAMQILLPHRRGHLSARLIQRKLIQCGEGYYTSKRVLGYGFSLKQEYYDKSNIYMQIVSGQGVAGYLGELAGHSSLLDASDPTNVQFAALKATSFIIGTQFFINENTWIDLAYQQSNISYPNWAIPDIGNTDIGQVQFDKRHQKFMGGISWKVTPNFKVGFVGAYITRKTANTINQDPRRKTHNATFVIGCVYNF